MIYEDFVPISETTALITTGDYYTNLTEIKVAGYVIEDGKVKITSTHPFIKGKHLRLGNLMISYSDNKTYEGEEMEQPFKLPLGDVLYTKNKVIYFNDMPFIELWDDYEEMGNPFADGHGWIYFEARKKENTAPKGWEIWKFNIITEERVQVKEHGANPVVWEGKLYYSRWKGGRFDTYVEEIK